MADSGSSNAGIVAVLAIFVLVLIAGFFAWQGGWLSGGGGGGDTDIKVEMPSPPAPPPSEPPSEPPSQ